MIFPKKLENAVKRVKSTLVDEALFEERQLEREKWDALMEIVLFVNKMDYIKSSKVKVRFAYFLRSKYDYKETGLRFKQKVNTIEVMVLRVSKRLESLVGKNTIDMILDGKVSEAMKIFRTGTMSEPSYGYFLPEIVNFLPEPKYEMFTTIEECRDELFILGLLTKQGIRGFLERYNRQRLAHILYILSRDSKRLETDTERDTTLHAYFEFGHSTKEKIAAERDVLIRLFKGELCSVDGIEIEMEKQVDKAIKMVQGQNLYYDAGSDIDFSIFEEG